MASASVARRAMLALAKRVEEGSGPDRDTDLAVLNLCVCSGYVWSDINEFIGGPRDIARRELPKTDEDDLALWLIDRDEYAPTIVPRYTSSLDLVVRLIETKLPGWHWMTRWTSATQSYDACGVAYVVEASASETKSISAPTPTRALLAAFLRAKASTPQDSLTNLADATKKAPFHDLS